MRKIRSRHLLVLVCLLFVGVSLEADDRNPFPDVAKSYLIELNGKLLWEKDANEKLPLASLTKLITAILAIEHTDLNREVTVSKRAARETGTKMGLRPGERLYGADLLKAALISSANDACYALAESVNPQPEYFLKMMNEKALHLGMRNSHFTNPCGHDHAAHYSTANDLRILAKKSLAFDEIRQSVGIAETTVTATNTKRKFSLKTSNALIGRSTGVYGLKTGFTPNAGKCLIATVTREKKSLLLIFLNASDRWWDAYDIIDIAFQYEGQ